MCHCLALCCHLSHAFPLRSMAQPTHVSPSALVSAHVTLVSASGGGSLTVPVIRPTWGSGQAERPALKSETLESLKRPRQPEHKFSHLFI